MVLASPGISIAVALLAAAPALADELDVGLHAEHHLAARSEKLFGFGAPLAAPAGPADYVPRELAGANQRVKLAGGLNARFVTRRLAAVGDMIAFWPDDERYTHLVVCIEQARAAGGRNAGVQRVDVRTGAVETILFGTSRCDGIRRTGWGTILATEENGPDGRAYEILDPLGTTGHWIADRRTGLVRTAIDGSETSARVVQRPRLGSFSWEGIAITPAGVVYAGDELAPSRGQEGGAIFKFVPAAPRAMNAGAIADLAHSPFSDGTLYALRVGGHTANFGQGNERGLGSWIGPVEWDDPASPADRTSTQWARDNDATGFYRPEDLHQDTGYAGVGFKILWTNTGVAANRNWSETLSLVDPDPGSGHSRPETQRFVEGNPRFTSSDNLDVQPVTGNVYVVEDADFGEIWACLPDGDDENLQSDGCVSMLSVVDPEAEPTGFIFDGTGEVAYLVLQHGEQPEALKDFASNPVNGETDDLLRITGFETKKVRSANRRE